MLAFFFFFSSNLTRKVEMRPLKSLLHLRVPCDSLKPQNLLIPFVLVCNYISLTTQKTV